jgi:hypothetical protein
MLQYFDSSGKNEINNNSRKYYEDQDEIYSVAIKYL